MTVERLPLARRGHQEWEGDQGCLPLSSNALEITQFLPGWCLVMSKWAKDGQFPYWMTSKWATGWGLSTCQLPFIPCHHGSGTWPIYLNINETHLGIHWLFTSMIMGGRVINHYCVFLWFQAVSRFMDMMSNHISRSVFHRENAGTLGMVS